MHFKMLSAICFNLDGFKILLSGSGEKIRISTVTDPMLISDFGIGQENILGQGDNFSYHKRQKLM